MWNLLTTLVELVKRLGINFSGLMQILEKLMSIGSPPDLKDEGALRTWLLSLVAVLQSISEITPTEFDDSVAQFLRNALDSQVSWDVFYKLLILIASQRPGVYEESDAEMELARELAGKQSGASLAAIDPASIIMIITLIVRVIKMLRR